MTTPRLSEREHRLLVLLNIRDGEGYRCATAPEHDADAIAGAVWFALGNYWRPGEWELEWSRSLSQSYSHTFKRLREKGWVGRHEEPQEALGMKWEPDGYYFITGDAGDFVPELDVPRDLARRCRYKGCDRWLPPTEKGPTCTRCRFSREYREQGRYRGGSAKSRDKRKGPGYEEFVRTGTAEVVEGTLLSVKHAMQAMGLLRVLRKDGGPTPYERWREVMGDKGPFPTAAELTDQSGKRLHCVREGCGRALAPIDKGPECFSCRKSDRAAS